MRRHLGPAVAALVLSLALPAGATSADQAEEWVREIYYEGFPAERAEALSDAAVERLTELLADPDEAAHHGNVVLALGYSAHPEAFPALAAYAAETPEGEVDRATFRARTQLRIAFGHLARVDRRALRWLLDAQAAGEEPAWHFRHHRDDALRTLLDELAITGLGLSGAPAAAARLDQVVAQSQGADAATQRRLRHAQEARGVHDLARDAQIGPGLPR
jgi:hypothetical protein